MGTTAQLLTGANVEHAHGLAILLAEQHHRAGFLGGLNVHHLGGGGDVGQNFSVHTIFDLADLCIGHGGVVRKVKAGALGVHQAALLLHMVAQHFAQGFVHQVGGGVVAHGGSALGGVHLGRHRIADFQAAGLDGAVVAKHIGLDFLGVAHFKLAGVRNHQRPRRPLGRRSRRRTA